MKPSGRVELVGRMSARPTQKVLKALTAEGAVARFVGGCVRDAILGREVADIDLATDARPEDVMELLSRARIQALPIGLKHGTVTAVLKHWQFEITTLRVDVETYGRHADVAFTDDWLADASRRDFTMNAMYADADGTLYDPFEGREDIRRGHVRFVGDARQRIEEDRLRLLRFFRFFAHFGRVPPDAETLAACRHYAPELTALSAERVRVELLKTLEAPDPADAFALMLENHVLDALLGEATRLDRLAAMQQIELAEARDVLEAGAGEGRVHDGLRRLAALLEADGETAQDIAARLRLSRAERARLINLLAPPAVFTPPDDPKTDFRPALYRLGRALFVDLVLMDWATRLAAGSDQQPVEGAHRAALHAARRWKSRALPVQGRDVLALGIRPGPDVSRLLARVEDWWLGQGLRPGRRKTLRKLRELAAEAGSG
ncbi:MAG: CCA tRNA nucleotidyltransferase [Alphaproteobacteria bacterium]